MAISSADDSFYSANDLLSSFSSLNVKLKINSFEGKSSGFLIMWILFAKGYGCMETKGLLLDFGGSLHVSTSVEVFGLIGKSSANETLL